MVTNQAVISNNSTAGGKGLKAAWQSLLEVHFAQVGFFDPPTLTSVASFIHDRAPVPEDRHSSLEALVSTISTVLSVCWLSFLVVNVAKVSFCSHGMRSRAVL